MTEHSGTAAFRAARDHLLELLGEPERARRDFEWPDVGAHFNWVRDWFDVIAEGNDELALRLITPDDAETSFTFDELRRLTNRMARWLRDDLGLERGDIVMLMASNRIELWTVFLAVMKAGAIVLPTSPVLGPLELVDRVERANVKLVFAAPQDAAKFADVPGDYSGVVLPATPWEPASDDVPEGWRPIEAFEAASDDPVDVAVRSEDPAIMYFTSGTTSLPKIVSHSQTSYPVGHLTTMYWIGVRPGDTHCVIGAPGWGKHAWSALFAPWNAGATVLSVTQPRFDATHLVAWLDRAGVTSFCAPPTVWRMIIQERLTQRPRELRELLSAGEPLNPEVIARIREWWGLDIRDGFGQTETTCSIGNAPGDAITPGAMGRPLPGVPVVLIDPLTGREADEGEVCLDLTHGWPPSLMLGYVGNPAATEHATRGSLYHSGDVAVRGEDGSFTFVGRTDDIFKASDYKVSPFEVESALIEHDAVAEAAVVGAPDATRLNVTKAYVSLARGATGDRETAFAILRHARATLPPYMRVRRVEFFELPKTASGKIRRVELRQREEAAAAAGERLPDEWREEDFPELKR